MLTNLFLLAFGFLFGIVVHAASLVWRNQRKEERMHEFMLGMLNRDPELLKDFTKELPHDLRERLNAFQKENHDE